MLSLIPFFIIGGTYVSLYFPLSMRLVPKVDDTHNRAGHLKLMKWKYE